MYVVSVSILVRNGFAEQFLAATIDNATNTRRESGNIRFDVLRDAHGNPAGFSILNQRVGPGSGLLFSARPGDRFGCLGPLGRPFSIVRPPFSAWMVAGA